jgi:Ciliary rootlet component, centrosome cohesion
VSNDTLTSDLQKLTNDWEQLRDELMIKEDEWKEEEQVRKLTLCKFSQFDTNLYERRLSMSITLLSTIDC